MSKQKSCDSCDHYTSFHGCMVHGYFLNKCIDNNYRDYKEDKVKYSKGIEL